MRITIALLFILFGRLYSQTPGGFSVISANEGLSQGMVFDVLQSKSGFLWIATKDGLNRYDGYRFEVYSTDPFEPFSLGFSQIHQFFEDSRGWLWLGYEGGMDIFMPETGRFFHLSIGNAKDFDGFMHSFAEMPDGTMWVNNLGSLWKIEAVEAALRKANETNQPFPDFKFSKVEAPPDIQPGIAFSFNSVIFSKDKTLLTATSNGLYRIETSAGKPRLLPETLPGISLYIIGEDSSGWLWMTSEDGFWVRKNQAAPPQKITASLSNSYLRFDPEGNLWKRDGGILRKWRPTALAAGGNPILELDLWKPSALSKAFYLTTMTIDRSGNVWMGTSGYGIIKVAAAKPKFLSYLPVTSHRMVVEDPNGNLLPLRNPETIYSGNQFERGNPNPWLAKFPSHKSFDGVAFDERGNAWLNCSDSTFCRIAAGTKDTQFFNRTGIGLLYSKNRKMLTVTEEALMEFDPVTEKSTAHPFDKPLKFNYNSTNFHNYFYEDGEGTVWIFAFEGLLKAVPTGQAYRFEQFKNNPADRTSLSHNLVFSVAEDPLEPRRYMWVGTKGGGLNRLDLQTGKFRHYKTEQGLPDNVVYGILSDKGGHIWLSTNKGLSRFDVREETFKNFTAADGLQSNEFNQGGFQKTNDGTMIFGGVNGLTVFHPDSLHFNERKPQTAITGVWVNNQSFEIQNVLSFPQGNKIQHEQLNVSYKPQVLRLAHQQNLILLEFAALDFTNPDQNLYRYQLVGVDEDWVELGTKNSVQFANLQPGSYTFKVLGSNNDGFWSETPATLEIVIHPPWWATWLAYLLYLLAVGGIIWFFYRRQLRQKLEHQETLRLRELDEFKNRFFTNITHEFRTPLTVILGMTDQVEQKVGEDIKPKVGLIRRNGQNLLRLINQILDLAKLESNTLKINYVQGDMLPYLRYIAESLHSFANAQNVMLRVESKEREIVMDYDPERLLQIVYNLLSNAIKFTPSGGRVDLRVTSYDLRLGTPAPPIVNRPKGMNQSSIVIQVIDTGVGIPPEDLPHIFDRFCQANNLEKAKAGGTGIGLALTKELVHALGGKISVESEVGKGATFTVILPITQSPLTPKGEPQLPHAAKIPEKINSELPILGSPLGVRSLSHEGNPTILQSYNPTILIIEDNPDVVEYLAACLQENYQLDFAYNGRAGIEKALETVPDLIVSDVMMPEKDGFEVCETLKNDERTSHVPIILLTAKAGVENRIAGLRRGADAYLSKPFHQEELLVTLANLLEMRRKLQAKYSVLEFSPSSLPPDPEDAFLLKLRTAVESRLSDSNLSVDDICKMVGMSHPVIHRKVTALTGRSLTLFVRSIRLAKAKALLAQPHLTISEVAYETGFNDPKFFSRVFSEEFGMSPTVFRQQS